MDLKPHFESPYATTLRTLEVAGLGLSELIYSACLKMPKHSHADHRIIVRLQGSSIETYGNESIMRMPSSASFYFPGDIHSDHFLTPGVRNLNIEFWSNHNFSSFCDWLRIPSCSFVVSNPALSGLCPKLYSEFCQPDELSALTIEGLVMEIVALLLRVNAGNPAGKPPRWLQQARELVRSRYAEHLTLADIAASVGTHPVHLARWFRKFYKYSIGEYVRQLRVEFAMEQISKRNWPLSDLALAAGFSDQSHFSRTFRKLTGITPRQFKEMSHYR